MGTDSFEEDAFNTQVVRVIGHGDGNFTFHFIDGRKITNFGIRNVTPTVIG